MKKANYFNNIPIPDITKKPKEYILFEHVGISDKSIRAVLISMEDSLMYFREGKVYKVREDTVPIYKLYRGMSFKTEKKVFTTLKKIILSYKESKYKGIEFGTFKITHHNANGENLKYNLNRTTSVELFQKLIDTVKLLDNYDDLLMQLKETLDRID